MPPLSPFSKSFIALAVSQLMLTSQTTNAATITVDTNADDDGPGCTLREAIVSANTDVDQENGCMVGSVMGADTITFDNSSVAYFSSNTILLSTNGKYGLAVANKNIEINASDIEGGITLDVNGLAQVLNVSGGSSFVTLDNMTLTGGSMSYGGAVGVYSSNVTLNNCTVTGNVASGNGGAFSVVEGGNLILNNTTVSENSAASGGAIEVYSGAVLTVTNSTISGNSASENASAILSYYSPYNTVNITNSTIANNVIDGEAAYVSQGGAISIQSGDLSLVSSIIADTEGESNCHSAYGSPDVGLVSVGVSSIIEGDVGGENFGCNASRIGDPGLLALADNGGVLTHALSEASIARNTGVVCPMIDQAGQVRDVTDGFCDIGALEFNEDFLETTTPFIIRLPNGKAVIFDL